jgi:hypothetical protein
MKEVKSVREIHADFTCIVTLSSTIVNPDQLRVLRHAITASLESPLAEFEIEMTEIGQNTKRVKFGDLLLYSANFVIEANLKDPGKEPKVDAS